MSQIQTQPGPDALKTVRATAARIMIVDDNVEFLEELQEILCHSGYDTEIVSDSTMAFERAQTVKPDLLLVDLKMSPKSGFQLAGELHHSPFMKNIPIIAMTGFFTEEEHVMMMQICGIKAFILKPFQPESLIAKVEFALKAKKGG